ncbi:hypothetical protein DID97_20220 [Burkholderia sp. Bp8977]|nr:hypothetical protein DIE10_22375 [Burkholderia sp. Bp9011]RQR89253.1 hypothetical protein DIE09_23820 [Burkholderia sp. Bp9010]RQS33958.1 hypothetical protein DIE05_01745 [Burkholderia sp. Bp8995]RQS50928.1 hypothetical protein DIE00_03450 [Burkholderia sp. Bp8989]RQS72665.1 hypothetical protein DID97_20220 [Burkholderia sp. Bp8977]
MRARDTMLLANHVLERYRSDSLHHIRSSRPRAIPILACRHRGSVAWRSTIGFAPRWNPIGRESMRKASHHSRPADSPTVHTPLMHHVPQRNAAGVSLISRREARQTEPIYKTELGEGSVVSSFVVI